MLGPLLAAAALAFATPPENDCAAAAHAECVALMSALYRSTNPDTGAAVRLIDGARWIVTPVAIARFADHRSLIVSNESEAGFHVEMGSWSLYAFDPSSSRLISRELDFRQSGSFGHPGTGKLIILDGETPALLVESGGTWQGHTCLWASVDIIQAAGTVPLIHPVLISFAARGEQGLSAEWADLSLASAALAYTNGQRFQFQRTPDGSLGPDSPLPQRC